MKRASSFRLLGLMASLAVVLSCDAGSATGPVVVPGGPGGGGAGGGSGSGGSGSEGDGSAPIATIDTPSVRNSLVNIGDSILVAVRLRDNASGIRNIVIAGLAFRGNRDLGTDTVVERFGTVTAPATGDFPVRTGVGRDTVIRRYIFPKTPIDTVQDSLVIRAIATDHSGLSDTATQVVRMVTGPRVTIVTPTAGDSVLAGNRLIVTYRATHTLGVSRVAVRVRGDANWAAPLDTTIVVTYGGGEPEVTGSVSVLIPRGVPGRSRITITAEALDVNRVPGEATPVQLFVRATPADVPRVTQVVPPRAEISDSVTITANGDGIASIGFTVRDSAGAIVKSDTLSFSGSEVNVATRTVTMPLALAPTQQGRRLSVTSFAIDQNGRTGYSTTASAGRPESDPSRAISDTVSVVFGQTYALPRSGIAGDIAVDAARGNVFVSNTSHNLVEVWNNGSKAFAASGVAVGAEPWGMTLDASSGDTLLVANSGGTNISRVLISGAPSEVDRILTRNTIAYRVRESLQEGKYRLVIEGPFSYSDRPQYIAQSAGGRIYYSTRPTESAPAGTLRYLDPSHEVPDSRQIWQYGAPSEAPGEFTIFNIDFVGVRAAQAESAESDTLVLCDHPSGTADPTECVFGAEGVGAAMAALIADVPTTDAAALPVDIASLALTDTTFVAWSGDRRWIAFGEGNTAGAGRVMMANDPGGPELQFFSDGVDVADIVDNASEPVFGLALDQQGKSFAAHGIQSYFGAVERPFHLRMQGRYDSFDAGAGITYHPSADVDPRNPGSAATRLAFVASANGTIEIVDAYQFRNRGRLDVRGALYGPLRASLPLPGDPAGTVLKLYGLTERGLVVINVNANDIKP